MRNLKNEAALKVLGKMLTAIDTGSNIPLGYHEDVKDAIITANIAIKQNDFLDFLYNIIPPNEMEAYISMYNCSDEKNNS